MELKFKNILIFAIFVSAFTCICMLILSHLTFTCHLRCILSQKYRAAQCFDDAGRCWNCIFCIIYKIFYSAKLLHFSTHTNLALPKYAATTWQLGVVENCKKNLILLCKQQHYGTLWCVHISVEFLLSF